MGLFDKLKNTPVVSQPSSQGGNKSQKIVFSALPDTFEQFCSMPQASLATPFDTAAIHFGGP